MKRDFQITDASGGAAFAVSVITRASRTELAAIEDNGTLKIRLTAAPTDDESNMQLIEFLADVLEVDTSQVEIVVGENARNKLVSVKNISPDILEDRLRAAVTDSDDFDDF